MQNVFKFTLTALVLLIATHTSSANQSSCNKVKSSCPPWNGVYVKHLRNPDDCGSYCRCDWNNIFWMPCPTGLHFNANLEVCDWPSRAGCTSEAVPLPINAVCNCPSDKESTLVQHSSNCNRFCACSWGASTEMYCPSGLHFNVMRQQCDWPATAGCTLNQNSTQEPTRNGCDKITSCPAQNVGNTIHLPNPDDCGSFCQCDYGKAVIHKCPAGLHFNNENKVCDWPNKANCNIHTLTPSK